MYNAFVVGVCCRKPVKGSDPCTFRHFFIYCLHHGTQLSTLGEIGKHHLEKGEGQTDIKMLCGCCGSVYQKIDELTNHVNIENFHLRLSEIPGYHKDTFNVGEYSAQQQDRNALQEAAAVTRSPASAQAAAAVAS